MDFPFIDWQLYWKCDWTMNIGANWNAHGKRTVSTKQPQVKDLTSWASRLWRGTGIELVFKSLDCFTVQPFFSTRPITRSKSFSFFFFFFFFLGGGGGGGGGVLSSFYYLCCIPISRPPRVIRRFKRRSCFIVVILWVIGRSIWSIYPNSLGLLHLHKGCPQKGC